MRIITPSYNDSLEFIYIVKYALVTLMLCPTFVFAMNFSCTINSVVELNDQEVLVTTTDWFRLGKVGDTFAVDGETGRIIGKAMLANDNSGIPEITKHGGVGNSFIVVTRHASGDYSILNIQT